jgi:hypothetical protein
LADVLRIGLVGEIADPIDRTVAERRVALRGAEPRRVALLRADTQATQVIATGSQAGPVVTDEALVAGTVFMVIAVGIVAARGEEHHGQNPEQRRLHYVSFLFGSILSRAAHQPTEHTLNRDPKAPFYCSQGDRLVLASQSIPLDNGGFA